MFKLSLLKLFFIHSLTQKSQFTSLLLQELSCGELLSGSCGFLDVALADSRLFSQKLGHAPVEILSELVLHAGVAVDDHRRRMDAEVCQECLTDHFGLATLTI